MKPTGAGILRTGCLLLLCALCAPALAQELRVGVYQNEPKVFVNEQGEATGIFIDLLREIARREQWTLNFQRCEWDECLRRLRAGELDLMPDVAWSRARGRVLDFHRQPALYAWSQIFAPPEDKLISVFQLQNRRIAVLRNSVQHDSFEQLLQAFGVDAVLVPVRSLEQGMRATAEGVTDAVISNDRFGLMYAPRYGLEDTPIVFDPTRLYFAAAGGRQTAVLEAIDEHLRTWRADNDSPYYQVLRRWQQQRGGLINAVPIAVWWGLAGLAVALLLSLTLMAWMRRLIARRTRSLRESEQRLGTILDSVGAFIYIKDRELRYTYANRATRELMGRTREQILGYRDADFFTTETAERLAAVDRRVIERGEQVQAEETHQDTEHAELRTFLSQKLPLRDATGAIYALCGISTDITERKRNEETVRRIAYYDALTGLPNRSFLLERLRADTDDEAGREPGLQGLIYIDLDDFKDLNDTLDHEVGDELLRQVGQRLGSLARQQAGVHAVRLGGDEFALLLEGLSPNPDQALERAERLAVHVQKRLGREYQLKEELRYQCSCSIGLSLSAAAGRPGEQADQLLRQAEMAMYRAKQAGRNGLQVFSPEIEAALAERISLEADMRQGLEQGQFRLVYQPQVDQEGRVIGAEALLRWNHPQRGNISPGVFIPLAEQSGLILPLGRWVLESACAQLARWAENPRTAGLSLAVNVSARQFRASGFVEELTALLERSGAKPERLKLELTETLLIEDLEEAAATAQRLSELGVSFSLDDFGTGYSSLAYLKRLPLSQLKIDQSFVRDILIDPVAEAIARSIISLGASLELAVIAEGVETADQRARLRELGCQTYQGFLFGRPDEVSALEAML